jgi:ADP-ribosylglycohydrolase
VTDPGLLSRAHGCLLGQIAGDSLGSLVEFQSAEAIRQRYPGGVRTLADGGTWNTIAGQPTDDSELALALARTIVFSNGYDVEAAAWAYGYWYASSPFDVGATTARALRAVSAARSPGGGARNPGPQSPDRGALRGLAALAASAANAESQANGSLMRVSPLGIWGHALDPEALAEHARADSRLTHPNVVCQEACAAFVLGIAFAAESGAAPTAVYEHVVAWARRACRAPSVLDALLAAKDAPPADYLRNAGWVLVALQNAFYQLLHAPSLEEGVVATVTAGGDTDTNGAIAGALLGAVHGREALPPQWRRLVLTCRPVAGAPGIRTPRPQPFWPVDALEIAERLVLAGAG